MTDTFFNIGGLGSTSAYAVSLMLGVLFGYVLEQAGFGSSRRLAGVFYFKDMAVVKVMFSALVTAMLGLQLALAWGWLGPGDVYLMPTVYGAMIVGGLIFGAGFVMAGWCPGTGAVGLASGKIDAAVFLAGVLGGSILFNELFPFISPLAGWGDAGQSFIYEILGVGRPVFSLGLCIVAVGCFFGAEWLEERFAGRKSPKKPLVIFSALLLLAALLSLFANPADLRGTAPGGTGEFALLQAMESGADHIEPEDLADRLHQGEPGLVLVDLRPAAEFETFHIRGAVNIQPQDLARELAPYRDSGIVVLYSNGMTHPAQTRDSLARQGFSNLYILTDGLKGFMERCLKPASLRPGPTDPALSEKIRTWRGYFLEGKPGPAPLPPPPPESLGERPAIPAPLFVKPARLKQLLGSDRLVLIDVRGQNAYNSGHVPGSYMIAPDSLRGVSGRVSSMLQPAPVLAMQFARIGLTPDKSVILIHDQLRDATLVALALLRAGHTNLAVLDGGYAQWLAESGPVDTALPPAAPDPAEPAKVPDQDGFTVDYDQVLASVQNKDAVIIDVRPAAYYKGEKSDEARAGHIPGAVNRPFTDDLADSKDYVGFKPYEELEKVYAGLIPDKNARVIVHCRTGHQASQTFLLLAGPLGYANVFWYDGGWSEWASTPSAPVER